MKDAKLQIGDRIQGSERALHIAISVPETVEELVANFPAALILRWAIRGMRIWLQDAILRPMYAENPNRPQDEYQAEYDKIDYAKAKARGRPRTPPTVVLADKETFTREEIEAALKAKGIKVE